MKVIITGAGGQLGQALAATAPAQTEVVPLTRAALDVTSSVAVEQFFERERPQMVINAAAYTHVDRAENEKETARAVNVDGVSHLAAAAEHVDARLVHVSTDFVFDGNQGHPYRPDDPTAPLNVYGATKRDGELAAGPKALIVRSAWIYAASGHNFVRTVLRLNGEQDALNIVDDQIGSPTYAPALARGIWALAGLEATGVYHYTDSGTASWYDFAVAILEEAKVLGLIERAVPVHPVPTSAYRTSAARPSYSILDKSKTWDLLNEKSPHWRVNLRQMLRDITTNG